MCDVATALMTLQIGGSVLGFASQQQTANAQLDQIQEGQRLNAEAFAAQRADLLDVGESEISDRVRQAKVERGRLRVAQGESGLSGVSFQRLENDVLAQQGRDVSRIQSNTRRRISQTRRDESASNFRAQSNALQVRKPSLVATGLQIGSAVSDYGVRTGKF